MTTDDRHGGDGILTALGIGCWVAFFGMALAISAYSLIEVHPVPVYYPELRFGPVHHAVDTRAYVTLGFCVFASALLLVAGLMGAMRYVLRK